MGRVPPLVLVFFLFGLVACEAEPPSPPPPPPPASEVPEEAVRDAAVAAHEAIERASEVLRKLGAAAIAAGDSVTPEPPLESRAPAPVEEAHIADTEADTRQAAAQSDEQAVERDASAAAAEATEKLVDVTKRAVETVRSAGEEVVKAIRDEPKAPATE